MPMVSLAKKRKEENSVAMPAELLQAVFRSMPLAMMTVLIVSTALVFVLGGQVDQTNLLLWWSATNLVALARLGGVVVFRRLGTRHLGPAGWRRVIVLGAGVSGLLWGAASWWIWPQTPLYQALMMVMIAGMVAGAVTTLGPVRMAAVLFILFSTLPLAARFLLDGDAEGYLISGVIVLFAALTSVSAARFHATIRTAMEANVIRAQAEQDLHREALFDPLTNLPNRRFLLERLQQEFSRAKRHGYNGALLFLDLDNFKTINDSLGHHVGDRLLQEVAKRLESRFRDEDVAARLGGDEFVVMLSEVAEDPVSSVYEVEKVASQVRDLLHEPYLVEGHELFVSSSIGVSLFPQDHDNYQEVMKHADTAMYRAKAQGRDNYQFFLPDMQEEASRRLLVEKELRTAINDEQLRLYYQPQVDVDGILVGLEALVRWQHPEKGLISPSAFVGIADEVMLVHDLHAWVVKRACQDIERLIARCGAEKAPVVSVNVSARAFHHASFEPLLLEQVVHSGIPADKLCLEITETSVMERVETVIEKMHMLRRSGILFSVDDFGTGYSSLAYLKRLPVDSIKIDQAFVRDVGTDSNDAVIVETILAMAMHLGLRAVAEGVEDEATAEFLRARGCQYFQGWLYGRPEPLDEIMDSCCTW